MYQGNLRFYFLLKMLMEDKVFQQELSHIVTENVLDQVVETDIFLGFVFWKSQFFLGFVEKLRNSWVSIAHLGENVIRWVF